MTIHPIVPPQIPVAHSSMADFLPFPVGNTTARWNRDWIVRIPWKGKTVSVAYADIEVEVQIPNPSKVAQMYGVDPSGTEEGSMQFRWGTVIEMERIVVSLPDPSSLERLKDTWFRCVSYEIKNGVQTPDNLSVAFGTKVTGGRSGRQQDPADLAVVPTEGYQQHLTLHHDQYFMEGELMANVVNQIMQEDEELGFNHWLEAGWPKDAVDPWYSGSSVTRPASVQMQVRGYVGMIERSPGLGDYDAEAPEAAADATRTIETHFINVVTDVNSDGIIDADDDDGDLEEGQTGGKALLVNSVRGADVGGLAESDKNLRKILIHFSQASTSLSGAKIHIVADSLAGYHIWKDNQRQHKLQMMTGSGGYGYYVEVPGTGDDLELWIGATAAQAQTTSLRFYLLVPDNQAGGGAEDERYMARDDIKVTITSTGINVDSDNNGTVATADDEVEEEAPGLIAIVPSSGNPPRYSLVIRQHSEWSSIDSPVAKILKEGSGQVRIFDASGASFMGETDTSGTLSSGTMSGSGSVTFEIEGYKYDEVTLKLEVTAGGQVIAFDWLRLTVVRPEILSPRDTDSDGKVDDVDNEFTFSAASPGTLTIPARLALLPDSTTIRDYFEHGIRIRVSEIDDSHSSPTGGNVQLAWDHAFSGEATAGEGTYSGAPNNRWEATATFTTLPPDNGDFGDKEVTFDLLNPSGGQIYSETVDIQVFFPRDETNHPGGDLIPAGSGSNRSPNWFFYWNQVCGDGDALYNSTLAVYGRTPAMRLWSPGHTYSKDETWYSDAVRGSDTRRDGSGQTVTGIDLFANVVQHELYHTTQIASADALLGSLNGEAGSIWASGWSWNHTWAPGRPTNHWTLGPNLPSGAPNQPGVAGYNDDGDGTTDERNDTSEVGFPGCDDVNLDTDNDDVPNGWESDTIEGQAEAHETVPQSTHWRSDWGNPGKQHLTDHDHND